MIRTAFLFVGLLLIAPSLAVGEEAPNCLRFAGKWLHREVPQVLEVTPYCRIRLNECGVLAEVLKISSSSDGKTGKLDVKVTEVGLKLRTCPIVGFVTSCSFKRQNSETIEWDCPGVQVRGPFDRIDE